MVGEDGQEMFDRPPHEAVIAEQLNNTIDGGGLRFDIFSPDTRHKGALYTSAQNIARQTYFGTERQLDSYGATHDRTFVAGGQYTYDMDRLLFMPAQLTAGVEYNYNHLTDRYLGLGREMDQVTHIVGGFLQNEWRTEKFSLLIGGRLDKHNLMDKAVFSPRANIRYSPTESVGCVPAIRAASAHRRPTTKTCTWMPWEAPSN